MDRSSNQEHEKKHRQLPREAYLKSQGHKHDFSTTHHSIPPRSTGAREEFFIFHTVPPSCIHVIYHPMCANNNCLGSRIHPPRFINPGGVK